RVLRGVVAGVRDYGNRMGIPTVNGAVVCDPRYLGNPLVFCGTVGLIPADKSFGSAEAGDLIVALGGRTGRDGIHGATFSSGELTQESETVSGGAVQIGNAIQEKQVADVVLRARDRGLFRAITDCGAGGFSSAVGEMGAEIGADVKLERAPLKYAGLSYAEIWISEAQERMVLAVPPEKWPELQALAAAEDVEAVSLGEFVATGKLKLSYEGHEVADLDMHFLHDGRPDILRRAVWDSPAVLRTDADPAALTDLGVLLHKLLGRWNVASKEWIIRQYDHEVQGGSVIKPLVGIAEDGPSDAAVVTPVLGSRRGIAVGNGLQIGFGDLDPYRMAASAIDEAIRNVVAVGGDPDQICVLDNFCWGNTERPETFGSLCQAAFACRDMALDFGAPFISGKDSLNNEFAVKKGDTVERIVIPPTLLISSLAIVPDVRRAATMDLKAPGNVLLLVGETNPRECGGSQLAAETGMAGDAVPDVDAAAALASYRAIHRCLQSGLIRSCHDLSEGGLGVALAEMAFAGGVGAEIRLADVPVTRAAAPERILFAESNSRLILEVEPANVARVKKELGASVHAEIGVTVEARTLKIIDANGSTLIDEPLEALKASWQKTFAW
ncbi:MAG TPA: AIR synthase-related protein, partial [Planctomycetia bacterium]|nr:AIR synthase-related protein [Planctomycetia bacterium]